MNIRSTQNLIDVDTKQLNIVIEKLHKLADSKSKLADFDELQADLEWLQEYYKEKSWNDVTRWLSIIDNTLRETFSTYLD